MVFPFQQPIYQGSPIKTIHLQLMFHDFPSKNLHFFMGEVAKRLMKSHSELQTTFRALLKELPWCRSSVQDPPESTIKY
jgi:hypothetical protein